MTFKIEELTKTPSFEIRCNEFVSQAWDIIRRYSSISILALNETKYVLDPETEAGDGIGIALAALIMKVGNIKEDLVEKVTEKTIKERIEEEENSAIQNHAEVTIFGVGNELSFTQAELFAAELEQLAQNLGGELRGEKIRSIEPHPPEIHEASGAPYHEELRSMDYVFREINFN
jgi:hypothetical protein